MWVRDGCRVLFHLLHNCYLWECEMDIVARFTYYTMLSMWVRDGCRGLFPLLHKAVLSGCKMDVGASFKPAQNTHFTAWYGQQNCLLKKMKHRDTLLIFTHLKDEFKQMNWNKLPPFSLSQSLSSYRFILFLQIIHYRRHWLADNHLQPPIQLIIIIRIFYVSARWM